MTDVKVVVSGRGAPPGCGGVAHTGSTLWVKSERGWHHVLISRSARIAQMDIDTCDSWEEIFEFGLAEREPHWFERVAY